MVETSLEQRMTVVEDAVQALQKAMQTRQPTTDWLDQVIGCMKGEPDFDEVLALGRKIRQADKPAEGQKS